jgi:hypothetical protein
LEPPTSFLAIITFDVIVELAPLKKSSSTDCYYCTTGGGLKTGGGLITGAVDFIGGD